jgi:hypothetical protein
VNTNPSQDAINTYIDHNGYKNPQDDDEEDDDEDGYFEDTFWNNDKHGSTQYDFFFKNAAIETNDVNGKRAGNSQSDKQHKQVIPLKHTVMDSLILRRPKVNVHPSPKH